MSVGVNPPKTPVTKGSNTVAAATVPNVCKMPGPPAPFVPTPLPNIGRSAMSPKGYSKTVKMKGQPVAIKGATFESMGDAASKGTGGGLVSANTHGITKFVGPGSFDVKVQGKNVQLLADPMLNNCGGSGNPPNAATLAGAIHAATGVITVEGSREECPICEESPHGDFGESKKSKASAKSIANKLKVTLGVDTSLQTMLGVVHCRCGQKYADHSGGVCREFVAAAGGYMTHPAGFSASIKGRAGKAARRASATARRAALLGALTAQTGSGPAAQRAIDDALERAAQSRTGEGPVANGPGACGAQGALILVLEAGHLASAMTEQWFSNHGQATAQRIAFTRIRRDGKRIPIPPKPVGHGQSAPPCENCRFLVPMLICPKDKDKCP